MRVTFLLPWFSPREPVGGYKVAYEYANRLAARGHQVTVRQLISDFVHVEQTRLRVSARRHGLLSRSHAMLDWFALDQSVDFKLVTSFTKPELPDADVLIYTGWQTVELARDQPASKGSKTYFVQDYELLCTADSATRRRIEATYVRDFRFIAISSVVRETLLDYGIAPEATIPSGLDHRLYRVSRPITRRPARVGFPARAARHKGLQDALEALDLTRKQSGVASLSTVAYGPARPLGLPDWLEFVEHPTDADVASLLNDCSVFVLPSWYEGWGLPSVEAMACGAALVTYDNGGSRDYAIDGQTALVAETRSPLALAARVRRLLADDALRLRLADAGRSHVQLYRWDSAVGAFEECLRAIAANAT